MSDKNLTAMESKPLTKRERVFVEGIALNGLDRAEAFSVAFDEAIGEDEQYEKVLKRATRLFYRPHIQVYYNEIMDKVRGESLAQARWTKDVATEKLLKLIEKAEQELETDRITMARLTAITNSAKELNSLHGLNAPTKVEGSGGFVLHIIEDVIPD